MVAHPTTNGMRAVSAITGGGSTLWTTVMPGLVSASEVDTVKDATVSRFAGRDQYDLYISGRHTVPSGNGDSDRSWVLRGDTGEIVWHNDASDTRLTNPSSGPGIGGGAVPIDINQDGADDIAMVSQVDFVALDGRTGAFVVPPEQAIHALRKGTGVQWQRTKYGAVTVVDIDDDGYQELLVHNAQGGWGILSFDPEAPFSVAGVWKRLPKLGSGAFTYAAVADLDVDRASRQWS